MNEHLKLLDALLGEYVSHLQKSGMPTTANLVAANASRALKALASCEQSWTDADPAVESDA